MPRRETPRWSRSTDTSYDTVHRASHGAWGPWLLSACGRVNQNLNLLHEPEVAMEEKFQGGLGGGGRLSLGWGTWRLSPSVLPSIWRRPPPPRLHLCALTAPGTFLFLHATNQKIGLERWLTVKRTGCSSTGPSVNSQRPQEAHNHL